MAAVISDGQAGKRQQAYKTEIIGGVVVHTLIQVKKGSLHQCGYCSGHFNTDLDGAKMCNY